MLQCQPEFPLGARVFPGVKAGEPEVGAGFRRIAAGQQQVRVVGIPQLGDGAFEALRRGFKFPAVEEPHAIRIAAVMPPLLE